MKESEKFSITIETASEREKEREEKPFFSKLDFGMLIFSVLIL